MKATLALGGELDIASGAEVKEMGDGLLSAFRDSKKSQVPIRFPRTMTGTSDGTNRVILDFDAPPVGSVWKIVAVTTFGNDDSTVVETVRGALYTGGSVNNLSLANLVIPGLSFPSFTQVQFDLIVHAQETVLVTTDIAGTVGQKYGCTLRIEEWRIREQDRLNGAP